jgi:hypothetical protein
MGPSGTSHRRKLPLQRRGHSVERWLMLAPRRLTHAARGEHSRRTDSTEIPILRTGVGLAEGRPS